MARQKVTQGTRAPKKRAEKPVSEGIRRAAKRAGIDPDSAQHDALVLQALRRLRNARDMVAGEIGGVS